MWFNDNTGENTYSMSDIIDKLREFELRVSLADMKKYCKKYGTGNAFTDEKTAAIIWNKFQEEGGSVTRLFMVLDINNRKIIERAIEGEFLLK